MSYQTPVPTRPEPAPTGDRGGAPRYAAFLDLLLTVGHVDGMFHHHEQRFVRQYLDSVLLGIERSGTGSTAAAFARRGAWSKPRKSSAAAA